MNNKHFVMMDFLRFFCALFVALLHLVGSMVVPHNRELIGEVDSYSDFFTQVDPFVYYGWIGVPIFFTISGFIISISAERSDSPSQFIIDRALRENNYDQK